MTGGILAALAAALSWTFANAAIQSAARRLGDFAALVWAQLIALPVAIAGAALIDGPPGAWTTEAAIATLIAAVSALVAYTGLFGALARGKMAAVVPVISGWAVISVIVGVVGFGEVLTAGRAVGISLVVVGNILLATQGGSVGHDAGVQRRAVLLAVVSAIGFGALFPALDVVGDSLGRLWAVPAVWGSELVVAVPVMFAVRRLRRVPSGAREWFVAGRVGLLEVSGILAASIALGLAPVSIVSPVASLGTGLSVIFGVVVLHERLARGPLVGAILASAGVVVVSL